MQEGASESALGLMPLYCIALQLHYILRRCYSRNLQSRVVITPALVVQSMRTS